MTSRAKDLSSVDIERLQSLLFEYGGVISLGDDDLGCTDVVKHRIDTGDAAPIRQRARKLPFNQRGEMQHLVGQMLSRNIIEPAQGPWSSPVILVKKKDGSTRFCVDFRKVNQVTKKDAQPLPRIDDTLDTLGKAQWFSTLDLASGYWQVEVEPADREKTAFATAHGLYQFRVMPFGLCNAPGTFQRLMEHVLAGLHWTSCLVYLDDIIIFSQTVSDHLQKLQEVLARLQKAGLKIKPSKCFLMQRSVHYLGWLAILSSITFRSSIAQVHSTKMLMLFLAVPASNVVMHKSKQWQPMLLKHSPQCYLSGPQRRLAQCNNRILTSSKLPSGCTQTLFH